MNKNRNKKLGLIALVAVVLLTAGCGKVSKLKNGEELVASINGKKITTEDLYKELKKQGGSSVLINLIDEYIANKEVKTDDTTKEYANAQLEQMKTQYTQAGQDFNAALINAGYKNEAAFKDVLILDYKKQQVVKKFLEKELKDEEIDKYYKDEIFGAMTARHILIKPDVKDDASDEDKEKAEEAAKKKAEELIKKLEDSKDVEKTFKELAEKNSDDEATAKEGGLFSDFEKSEVVTEFWDASAKLKDGKYTKEPVKSDYGYHIIYRVSQKSKPKLKDVKDEIKETLVSNKLTNDANLSSKTWDRIRREKYKLKIEDSELNDSYKSIVDNIK
ncbi:MAG: hypothetical protein HFG15_04495 [Bacilli bacterium]|nr:hypothetical protein [Bacilli bacterium]